MKCETCGGLDREESDDLSHVLCRLEELQCKLGRIAEQFNKADADYRMGERGKNEIIVSYNAWEQMRWILQGKV